jgi:hypothetical protein
VQIRSQDLLSDQTVSIVAAALEAHREDIERGALLSINECGTRVRMLPLKRAHGPMKSASFVWLRTSLTERGARGDIRACEATPREEGLEAGVASV